jgi:FXSXX-COOH protein
MGDSSNMDDSVDLGHRVVRAVAGQDAKSGQDAHGASQESPGVARAVSTAGTPDQPGPRDDLRTALIDLSGLSLADLDAVGQTALAAALRRIVARGGQSADPVVGFQSSI